jgi:adenine phosphoribosyltransferase
MVTTQLDIRKLIKEYPNFPIPGVLFRDINPVLRNPGALKYMAEEFKNRLSGRKIDLVVGIESRGFIIATAIALLFQIGLVLIRKAGKLPGKTIRNSYKIEYGSDKIEVQIGVLGKNPDVLVADDLIATGGTAIASARILEQAGCRITGFAFAVELGQLQGARILRDSGYEVNSLVVYD